MSIDVEHNCDDCNGRKEVDHCLCDSCLETQKEEAFEEGKKQGKIEALAEKQI